MGRGRSALPSALPACPGIRSEAAVAGPEWYRELPPGSRPLPERDPDQASGLDLRNEAQNQTFGTDDLRVQFFEQALHLLRRAGTWPDQRHPQTGRKTPREPTRF